MKSKAQQLLGILEQDTFTNHPSYEKLQGDLRGAYSRRINLHHRLVYEVIESEHYSKDYPNVIILWRDRRRSPFLYLMVFELRAIADYTETFWIFTLL